MKIETWKKTGLIGIFLVLAGFGAADLSGGTDLAPTPLRSLSLEVWHIGLILLAALIVAALGGRNLGEFVRGLMKKEKDFTINVEPGKARKEDIRQCPVMATGGLPVNPELCMAHKAEHERSLRNQDNIGKLFEKFDHLKACFDEGFKQISQEIGDTKTEIIRALAIKGGR
jgi:hypothetical protein